MSTERLDRQDRQERKRIADSKVPVRVKNRRCQACGLPFPADEVDQDHDEHGNPTGWFCWSCI